MPRESIHLLLALHGRMSNFARALRLALCQRWNVAACIITSLLVAGLWAVNLMAVWPIVDAVMQDKSVPMWVDETIAQKETELNELMISAGEVAREIIVAEEAKVPDLKQQQEELADDVQTREASIEWLQKIKPHVDRWFPASPFETLCYICAFVLVGTLVKNIFRVINAVLVVRLSSRTTMLLRNQYYEKVLRLESAAFTDRGRGDLMTRCTTDLAAVSSGIGSLFGSAIREPFKMIACFIGAAFFSWRLLLLTILVVPIAVFMISWLSKALKRANRRALEELSGIYETLTETLSGIQIIKAFTMEPTEEKRFHDSARTLYDRQMRIGWYGSLVSPVTENLGVAMVVVAALSGGYLVLNQQTHLFNIRISDTLLTHGQMGAFFMMLAGMSDPARRLSGIFNQLQKASASADRVYEVLDRAPLIVDPRHPKPLGTPVGLIRFENVAFHYEPSKQVLDGVKLEVEYDETIAFVGPNGCGKSTLLSLLPRFYDVSSGQITLDGTNVRDVSLQSLRQRIGIVSQQAMLFNDTIAANIAYGTPGVSQELIEAAAKQAYAHQFITEKLKDGYQTTVGPGGSRLSGGQRQRIALARAILRDPEILILDEATSQIDIESEQLIHQVLKEFTKGRTTLVITHRPSTLSLADRVVVMDHGQIEDIGTPEELLDRCDLFRRLCHVGYRQSA